MSKIKYLVVVLLLLGLGGCATQEQINKERVQEQFNKDKEVALFFLKPNCEYAIKLKHKKYKDGTIFYKEYDKIFTKKSYIINDYLDNEDVSRELKFLKDGAVIVIASKTFKILQNIPNEGSLVENAESYNNYDVFYIEGIHGVDGDSVNYSIILKYKGIYTYETANNSTKTVHAFRLYTKNMEFMKDAIFVQDIIKEDEKYNNKQCLKKLKGK